MSNYTIQNCSTKVVLKKGKIEEEESDAIVNWVNVDMRSGPKSFYRIHQAAGVELWKKSIPFDDVAVECDCFSTNSGMLPCKIVLHTIIPIHKNNYLFCFQNMAETIKSYKKGNVMRTLSIFIPEMPEMLMQGIHKFLLNIGLDEVVIMYHTDKEYNILSEYFSSISVKEKMLDKIENSFWEFMIRFSDFKIHFLSGMLPGRTTPIEV